MERDAPPLHVRDQPARGEHGLVQMMSRSYPDTMGTAEHSDSPAPRSSFKEFLAIVRRGAVTCLATLGAMSIGVPGWVLLAALPVYGIVSYTRFRRQERREAALEAALRG